MYYRMHVGSRFDWALWNAAFISGVLVRTKYNCYKCLNTHTYSFKAFEAIRVPETQSNTLHLKISKVFITTSETNCFLFKHIKDLQIHDCSMLEDVTPCKAPFQRLSVFSEVVSKSEQNKGPQSSLIRLPGLSRWEHHRKQGNNNTLDCWL